MFLHTYSCYSPFSLASVFWHVLLNFMWALHMSSFLRRFMNTLATPRLGQTVHYLNRTLRTGDWLGWKYANELHSYKIKAITFVSAPSGEPFVYIYIYI
jgi:hypothetical protein